MKEILPFESYLPCDGLTFTVNKVKYLIHARIHHAIYPYVHDYINLSAEYKEADGILGLMQTWFIDLKQSESETCEKLFKKMQKYLDSLENK